jgi:hypothetical protein
VTGGLGLKDLHVRAARVGNAYIGLSPSGSRVEIRVLLVERNLLMWGGQQHDDWTLSQFGVGHKLTLMSLGGDDRIIVAPFDGQTPTGYLRAPSSVQGQLVINAGYGDDVIRVGATEALNPPLFHARWVTINGSDGNDDVAIGRWDNFDSLLTDLGTGDDTLNVVDLETWRDTWFKGGEGVDNIKGKLIYVNARPTPSDFETDTLDLELIKVVPQPFDIKPLPAVWVGR